MDGSRAYQSEQNILKALRGRGVLLGPKDVVGVFSGYTESWIEESFRVPDLATLLELSL